MDQSRTHPIRFGFQLLLDQGLLGAERKLIQGLYFTLAIHYPSQFFLLRLQ